VQQATKKEMGGEGRRKARPELAQIAPELQQPGGGGAQGCERAHMVVKGPIQV